MFNRCSDLTLHSDARQLLPVSHPQLRYSVGS